MAEPASCITNLKSNDGTFELRKIDVDRSSDGAQGSETIATKHSLQNVCKLTLPWEMKSVAVSFEELNTL